MGKAVGLCQQQRQNGRTSNCDKNCQALRHQTTVVALVSLRVLSFDVARYTMSRKPAAIKLVNLEEGRPTLESARLRLQYELKLARDQGYAAVKIIHGYGSSGEGGVLRMGVQASLRQEAEDGRISAFIPGEKWRISDETTWTVLQRYPEWKQERDLNRRNPGISIVVF